MDTLSIMRRNLEDFQRLLRLDFLFSWENSFFGPEPLALNQLQPQSRPQSGKAVRVLFFSIISSSFSKIFYPSLPARVGAVFLGQHKASSRGITKISWRYTAWLGFLFGSI